MNDLETYQAQLPETIDELEKAHLIERSKENAYRLKYQSICRMSDAQEIQVQARKDYQDSSIRLVLIEQRIGEILLSIEKKTGNQYKNAFSGQPEKAPTKSETVSEMGYSKNQVSEYQRLAQNPDIVQKVIDDAVKSGDVVTRTQVMKEIRSAKAELERQLAEKDKRISELESQKPAVVETVKEITVVADD